MSLNRVQIGTVTAQLSAEARHTPDDRQEIVKTITLSSGGYVPSVAVVDSGNCSDGETISYSGVVFTAVDWATVKGYWQNRTLVTVVGVDGATYGSCRVVIRQWTRNKHFASVAADIEIWRV